MRKRIFLSIFLASLITLCLSLLLFLQAVYSYFQSEQQNRLRTEADLTVAALKELNTDAFQMLPVQKVRISWIGQDGSVLYDSQMETSSLENHLKRPEIQQALKTGQGSSFRYSDSLLEQTFYEARKLSDGSVIRLSLSQNSQLGLLVQWMIPFLLLAFLLAVLSFFMAKKISVSIMAPLDSLNLQKPLKEEKAPYPELLLLMNRLKDQQKEIEQIRFDLLQAKEEFEAVSENMTEGIILLSSKAEIMEINPSARRILCKEEISPLTLKELDLEEKTILLSSLQKGNRLEKNLEKNGRLYQLNVTPVFRDGVYAGAVLLLLDITEKAQAEEMRREFTANVSHELRSPLQVISGSAELLENGLVQKEDAEKFYRQIHSEAERMILLIEDLMRLSSLDEGGSATHFEPVDLYALMVQSIKTLRMKAKKARIHLEEKGESSYVLGDVPLLQSIIVNLADNAIKYNRPEGHVWLNIKKAEDQILFQVKDDGIGISQKDLKRIFERFFRVSKSRSKNVGGTGLGLSIVKHAASLHQAQIQIQSKEGEGTEIIVSFPAFYP